MEEPGVDVLAVVFAREGIADVAIDVDMGEVDATKHREVDTLYEYG